MKLNFKIKDNIYIESNKHLFDLHNDFDFTGVKYEIGNENLILYYKSLLKNEEAKELQITHRSLNFIKIYKDLKNENDFEENDSKTISSMTFYPSDDRENNFNITYQKEPKIGDDIIYLFEGEGFIRLNCNEVILKIVENKTL